MKRALVIFAHPSYERSRANRIIVEHLRASNSVTLHDLYETYPNFHIPIAAEQALLEQHELIIMQHPFFWYSMPPLMKAWLDEVLELGFAYGEGGDRLRGKQLLLSITTGGTAEAYSPQGFHRHSIGDFLLGYRQIASLCGLEWLEPNVFHAASQSDDARIADHAILLRTRIESLCAQA